MTEKLKWRCQECGTTNTATNERHSMDYCEGCGETLVRRGRRLTVKRILRSVFSKWVDYEVAYSRCSIGVEYLNE